MFEWVVGGGLRVFFVLVGAGGAGGDEVARFLMICIHVGSAILWAYVYPITYWTSIDDCLSYS